MIVLFLAFASLSFHVGLLVDTFLKYDYTEVIRTVHEHSQFPYITICSLEPYSHSSAEQFIKDTAYNKHIR